MENTEFIEFNIKDRSKFEDFLRVYKLISESKINEDSKPDAYWIKIFPEYSIKHFFFRDTDLQPKFETANSDDGIWHFYSMTEHLIENLDVELRECSLINDSKGRLEFYAYGYPYGGITGLTMLLNSFDCKASKMCDGGGLYNVNWITENDFRLIELKDNTIWENIKSILNL